MRLGWEGKLWMAGVGMGLGLIVRDRYHRRRRLESADSLRAKVALVTGGSRGLGLLLARELAREGCRVAICARDERELERAKFELRRKGAEVVTGVCDVADREQIEAFVERIQRTLGPVEVLVNNAGVITVGPVETMTVPDFQDALGTMYWGTVYSTLAVLPAMLERGAGRIANVTSVGGKVSVPHLVPYCSAKFAALGFSQGLRTELSGRGITVTTIVPGLMRTGSHVNALFKGRQQSEYQWFGLAASLPLLSVPAEKAARQIVLAIKRGDAEYTVGIPARLLARFHGLFPSASITLAELFARFLPGAREQVVTPRRGVAFERSGESLFWNLLTALGQRASERLQDHQRPFAVSNHEERSAKSPI